MKLKSPITRLHLSEIEHQLMWYCANTLPSVEDGAPRSRAPNGDEYVVIHARAPSMEGAEETWLQEVSAYRRANPNGDVTYFRVRPEVEVSFDPKTNGACYQFYARLVIGKRALHICDADWAPDA